MCNTPLIESAIEAYKDCKNNNPSEKFSEVALIILVSTGMVSMLINPDFNGDRFDIYINGSYRVSTLQSSGTGEDAVVSLNLAQVAMDKNLTMNTWYRISGTVDLATGNITVSAHDISTGELVATKSRPSQLTSITRMAVQATKGYPNPIYSQN